MSDIDGSSIAIPGVVMASIGACAKLVHWLGTLWATISREKLTAEREAAALNRASDARIADQQSAAIANLASRVDDHTMRDIAAQAEVKAVVVSLASKIDTIASWQERTPAPSEDDPRPSLASERRKKLSK